MKVYKRIIFAIIISIIFIGGVFSSNLYYVQFKGKPEISRGAKVMFKNSTIGEVKDMKLTESNYISIKIDIIDKYNEKILESGVFYVEDHKLKYIILDENSDSVESGKYFLGFVNKYKYYIWKTKNWIKDGVKAIINKLKKSKLEKI